MRKINKKYITVVLVIILGIGGFAVFGINRNDKPSVAGVSTVKPASDQRADSISYKGHEGVSVLNGLKQVANVQTKQSSLGEYVVSINGSDGAGKKYWLFYINGKESSVGADAYVTKADDNIEWKLQ